MAQILKGILLCATLGMFIGCGIGEISDQGTDPAPEESVQIHSKQSAVYLAASQAIKATHRAFSRLRLWCDLDHDGVSDASELTTLHHRTK